MTSDTAKKLTYEDRVLLEEEEPALSILINKAKETLPQKSGKEIEPSDFITDTNKVALYASRNLTWNEVGKLYCGYTIVDADKAARWITHPAVRIATPEEVAKEFNK
jgi:hypothetical protein